MKAGWTKVALGELMLSRTQNLDPARFPDELFTLYSVPAFDSRSPEIMPGSAIGSAKQIVEPADVLLCRIVPHIRRAWVVGSNGTERVLASGEWIVLRSKAICPNYLRHLVVSDRFHAEFMATVAGVGGSLLRARPAQVARIKIPLPPLDEQRRIAQILDAAEGVRSARRSTLEALDHLSAATLSRLLRSQHSPTESFGGLLAGPLGNGLSPSTAGTHPGCVLTLSALSRGGFDDGARKHCLFDRPPAPRQMVERGTFLVSRGNGNLQPGGSRSCCPGRSPRCCIPRHDDRSEARRHQSKRRVFRRRVGVASNTRSDRAGRNHYERHVQDQSGEARGNRSSAA